MPSINDLKRNNINATNNTTTADDNSVVIDMTSSSAIESSMNHNDEVYNNRPRGKTIVNAPNYIKRDDGTKIPIRRPSGPAQDNNRVAFDLSKMPVEKDPRDEDIHESITDDLLTGKNPILMDYLKEKAEEMEQWTEDKEDERQLKIANGEINEDGTPVTNNNENQGVVIDLTQPAELDFGDDDKPSDNKNEELVFDKPEQNDGVPTNENYEQADDLFLDDDISEEELEKQVEEAVMENENTNVEVEDDIFEDINTTNNEEATVDEIDELINGPEASNVTVEMDVDRDTAIAEDAGEVDDVPEAEKSVSSEGIEFQDQAGLAQDEIVATEENVRNTDPDNLNPEDLDEATKYIIAEATKVLKPAAKKLDLSSFTVVKKPGNVNRFFKGNKLGTAKWVLRHKKVCIMMKASQGSELEELRLLLQNADSASDFIRLYRIIYDHIISPKPSSFEAWCKSNYTSDIDDYFFCFFIANYKDSNYIPYDCTNKECKPGTFLSDNIPIMNMVKFESDADKEEFKNIYKNEIMDTNEDGLYAAERIAFSNQVAIDFTENTLYSYIEAQSVRSNEAFINKYSGTIALAPNINNIYTIDLERQELSPVEYKVYENSNANTYKSKIQKYDTILKTLNPDEFSSLIAYVNTFTADTKKSIGIKYVRPEATCPKCGAKIEEEQVTAQSLVFYRYQLGQLVNISIK